MRKGKSPALSPAFHFPLVSSESTRVQAVYLVEWPGTQSPFVPQVYKLVFCALVLFLQKDGKNERFFLIEGWWQKN